MKIVGLILTRNSDWVIGLSARAALMWCDEIVGILHSSNDRSLPILETVVREHPGRVFFQERSYDGFYEMLLRDEMLGIARTRGATHIVTIDDDEVLSGNLLPDIRDMVEETPKGSVLMLPWLQLQREVVAMHEYWGVMTSGLWSRSTVSLAFPDQPACHWRARSGYDFHHRHPMGIPFSPHSPISNRDGGLMHLQFASRRRLVAKQFWYQLQEKLRWPGRKPVAAVREMYAQTVHEADAAQVSPVPETWWAPYEHLLTHLHIDREPWQERECKRLLTEHPGLADGLEDFGLMSEWGFRITSK